MSSVQSVVVIGGGTSGIVTAKYLLEAGVNNVRVFEKHPSLGGVFQFGVWKNAEMVSSKFVTSFSDFTMDEWWSTDSARSHNGTVPCPMHMSTANYTAYLEAYAKKYSVLDLIEFGTRVESVEDLGSPEKGYNVRISRSDKTETLNVDAVLVCSGLHQTPRIPGLWTKYLGNGPAEEGVKEATVIHSQDYKSQAQIPQGGRVLICGGGETAHDIAAQAVEGGAAEVSMSLGSDGYIAVPKEMFGPAYPLDVVIANAFEHYGEQSWVHDSHLRWRCMTPIIRAGFLLGTGSSHGFNQLAGRKQKVERGRHFIMKTGKSLPYLNRPIALSRWYKGYPWRWLFPLGDKSIFTLPTIETVRSPSEGSDKSEPVTCAFKDLKSGEMISKTFDKVILCTGYSPTFPFLKGDTYDHWPPTKRNIASPERYNTRLGFIGFIRPNVGAIPPMAELQAMWWVHFHILSNQSGRTNNSEIAELGPSRYTLLDKKKAIVEYGSDFGSYMFQVGEDMKATPNLLSLAREREWKILILALFGQSYTQLFRVHGPFASEKCRETCRNLVDKTIWKRGLVSNLILLAMTALFGWINVVLRVLELLLQLVGVIRKKRGSYNYLK